MQLVEHNAPSGIYNCEWYNRSWGKKGKINLYVTVMPDGSCKVWGVPPDMFQGFMRFETNGTYDSQSNTANVSGSGVSLTINFSGMGKDWRVHAEFKSGVGNGTYDGKFSGNPTTVPP